MKTQTLKATIASLLLTFILLSGWSCSNQKSSQTQVQTVGPELPIHAASVMGDVEAINEYIKANADLNAKDEYGSTALTISATFGKPEVTRLLLEGGADINATGADGSSALHTAAFFGRTEIVKMLLSEGIDTEIRNAFGVTALESVRVPFSNLKMIYDQVGKDLKPLGLELDYEQIKASRHEIVKLIQDHKRSI